MYYLFYFSKISFKDNKIIEILQKNQQTTAKAPSKTSSQKGSKKEETKKLNEKKEVKKK